MKKPTLYVFSISHYCEKARWALDYCGVDYQLKCLIPATYAKTSKALGAPRSSVPILQTDSGVIQGSADIIAWVNTQTDRSVLINEQTLALEKRFDDVLGVHVRRWFYSEALLDCPEIVRPVFANGASLTDKLILRMSWPKVVPAMIKRMDLGVTQEAESREIVLEELGYIESLLTGQAGTDPKEYLFGETLSNADITAASLLAPMFGPPEHPMDQVFEMPPRLATTAMDWQDSAAENWILGLYEKSRKRLN